MKLKSAACIIMGAAAIVLVPQFFLLLNFTINHEVKILSHLNNRVLKFTEPLNRTHPLQLLAIPSLDSISCLKSHLFKLVFSVLSDQLHLFLLRYLGCGGMRWVFDDDSRLFIYSFARRSTLLIFKCI